jgi:hypothetical protein
VDTVLYYDGINQVVAVMDPPELSALCVEGEVGTSNAHLLCS